MQITDEYTQAILAPLELEMQELEAMEAPGFWDVTGYISGAAVGSAVSYVVVTISVSGIVIT